MPKIDGVQVQKYILTTQEEIDKIVLIASREGIKSYQAEMDKAEAIRERERDPVRKTKHLLVAYRRLKRKLNDEMVFTEDEMIDLRWKFLEDLMGTARSVITRSETYVITSEMQRKKDMYNVQSIEHAAKLFREEADQSPSAEFRRRYREMYDMYLSDVETTIQQIAENECISEKTVYKDLNIACQTMATYLIGVV